MSAPNNAETVYIALGSNLDNPLNQVCHAVTALDGLPKSCLIAQSPWYRSAAIGPGEQPDYINGVACLKTSLSPECLLDALHTIECAQGRTRWQRWAARTLDLDILLYGDRIVATDRLQIPHPRLHQRNFVLYPLADLAPQLRLPDGQQLATLLSNCGDSGITKLTDREGN